MKRLLLAVLLLGCAALTARPAAANGIPIRVPLTYLAGRSTWGPTDARGEAAIRYSEAALRLDARGLPQLTGETYAVWLVKSGTNKAVAVGTFTSPGGVAGFTGKLANLDGYEYDLVMITAESLARAGTATFTSSGTPGASRARVVSGALEGSNVDPTATMTAMTMLLRAFESGRQAMQLQNETLNAAVNQVGSLR